MYEFFEGFVKKMVASFRRIARATKNDVTAEDLQQDAWIIALELGEKRGKEIDFSDPADQELVLRSLNYRNVKRGDWKLRNAVRIDEEPEGEDDGPGWIGRLPAPENSNPLTVLLARERETERNKLLASSYSQAAAYVVVFTRFKNDRKKICAYLALAEATLARRVAVAIEVVQNQPSLFDRIERIRKTFVPLRGSQYLARPVSVNGGIQWGWEF